MDETKQTFDCHAILELFGHVRLAGHVTEATIGGCALLRVDVPYRANEEGEGVKFTRYYGNGAIYSMTPVTEETARLVGDGNSAPAVQPWEMPKPQLPSALAEDESGDRDYDDYSD